MAYRVCNALRGPEVQWLVRLKKRPDLRIKVKPNMSTSASGASQENVNIAIPQVKISEQCSQRLKKVAGNKMLRVSVDGGGCSGFQYKFELDTVVTADDIIFERDGAKVVTDEVSLEYLGGSTVDFHEELIRSAFRIVNNPKAEQGCSCGASFSVKL